MAISSISGGSASAQSRRDLSLAERCRRNSTSEATVVAAAGTGRPTKSLFVSFLLPAQQRIRDHVEAGEPDGRAQQVDEAHEPADVAEDLVTLRGRENKEKHHQRRGDAERNHVRQRVELRAEKRLAPAHAREAAIQHVEARGEKMNQTACV